jgi:Na+/melibiose symporter-like transporter
LASQDNRGAAPRHLSLPGVLAFASASIPIQALVLAVSVHLLRYFTNFVGMEQAMVGAAFAAVRLIDIPIDVAMGAAMDRTRTRFGRYRIWLAAGGPVLMAGLWVMLQLGPDTPWLGLASSVLFLYLGYSMVYLSHLAWGGVIGASYTQRSRVFGAILGLGVVGAMAVLLIPVIASAMGRSEFEGVRAMMWFIIGAVPVTVLLVSLSTREPITPRTGRAFRIIDYLTLLKRGNVIRLLAADLLVTLGPGWMAAIYFFYFEDSRGFDIKAASVLLMVYIGAGFAGAPLAAWLANRIGKHRALLVATSAYSIGLVILTLLPKGVFAAFVPGMFIMGAMATGANVMIRALTGDIADEARLDTGRDWMGLMYALTIGTTKVASAGSALTLVVLQVLGYYAGHQNSAAAIRSLELVYIVVPIVCVMAGGACFIGYRLTPQRHAEIRRELDIRDGLVGPVEAIESLAADAELATAGRAS